MATTLSETLSATISAELSPFKAAMADVQTSVNRMANQTKTSVDKANRSFTNLEKTGKKVERAFVAVKSVIGAAIVAKTVREVIQYTDAWTSLTGQLRQTVDTADELVEAQNRVFAIAQSTRGELSASATLYARLSAASEDLGATSEDVARVVELVNKAFVINATDAGTAAGATLQLSQALGGAKIQAQEYNSLIDGARPLLKAVAEGMDEAGGSVNKLTQLVKAGEVSGKEFFDALLEGGERLDRDFSKAGRTVGQSMTVLGNSLTRAAGRANEAVGAVDRLSEAIGDLATIIDGIPLDWVERLFGKQAQWDLAIRRMSDFQVEIRRIEAEIEKLETQGSPGFGQGLLANMLGVAPTVDDLRGRLKELRDEQDRLNKTLEQLSGGYKETKEEIEDNKPPVDELTDAQKDLLEAYEATTKELEARLNIQQQVNSGLITEEEGALRLARTMDLLNEHTAEQADHMDRLRRELVAAEGVWNNSVSLQEVMDDALKDFLDTVVDVGEGVADLNKDLEATQQEQTNLTNIINNGIAAGRDYELILRDIAIAQNIASLQADGFTGDIVAQATAMADTEIAYDRATDALEDYGNEVENALLTVGDLRDAWNNAIDDILEGGSLLGNIEGFFTNLGERIGADIFEGMLFGKKGFDDAIIGNMSELFGEGGIIGTIVGESGIFESLFDPKLIKAGLEEAFSALSVGNFSTAGIGFNTFFEGLGSVGATAFGTGLGMGLNDLFGGGGTGSMLGGTLGGILGSLTPLGPLGGFIGSFAGSLIGGGIEALFGDLFGPGRIASEKKDIEEWLEEVLGLPAHATFEQFREGAETNFNAVEDAAHALAIAYGNDVGGNIGTVVRFANIFQAQMERNNQTVEEAEAAALALANALGLDLFSAITEINDAIVGGPNLDDFTLEEYVERIGEGAEDLVSLNDILKGTIELFTGFSPVIDEAALANHILAEEFTRVALNAGIAEEHVMGMANNIRTGFNDIETNLIHANNVFGTSLQLQDIQLDPEAIETMVNDAVANSLSIFEAAGQSFADAIASGVGDSTSIQESFEEIMKGVFAGRLLDEFMTERIEPLVAAIDFTQPMDVNSQAFQDLAAQVGILGEELFDAVAAAGLLPETAEEASTSFDDLIDKAQKLSESLIPEDALDEILSIETEVADLIADLQALTGPDSTVQLTTEEIDLLNTTIAELEDNAHAAAVAIAEDFTQGIRDFIADGEESRTPLQQLADTYEELVQEIVDAEDVLENYIDTAELLSDAHNSLIAQQEALAQEQIDSVQAYINGALNPLEASFTANALQADGFLQSLQDVYDQGLISTEQFNDLADGIAAANAELDAQAIQSHLDSILGPVATFIEAGNQETDLERINRLRQESIDLITLHADEISQWIDIEDAYRQVRESSANQIAEIIEEEQRAIEELQKSALDAVDDFSRRADEVLDPLGSQFADLEREAVDLEEALRDAGVSGEDLTRALADIDNSLEILRGEIVDTFIASEIQPFIDAGDRAGGVLQDLQRDFNDTRSSIRDLESVIGRTKQTTDLLASATSSYRFQLQRLRDELLEPVTDAITAVTGVGQDLATVLADIAGAGTVEELQSLRDAGIEAINALLDSEIDAAQRASDERIRVEEDRIQGLIDAAEDAADISEKTERDRIKGVIDGIEATRDADIAALEVTADAHEEFLQDQISIANDLESISKTALKAFDSAIDDLIQGPLPTFQSLMAEIVAATDPDVLRDLQSELIRVTRERLQREIEAQREASDAIIAGIRDQQDVAEEAFRLQREAAIDSLESQEEGIEEVIRLRELLFDEEQQSIRDLLDVAENLAERARDVREQFLFSSDSLLSPRSQLAEIQTLFDSAITDALAGDFTSGQRVIDLFPDLTRLARETFGGTAAAQDIINAAISALEDLEAMGIEQVSEAEEQLAATEDGNDLLQQLADAAEAAGLTGNESLETLNSMLQTLQEQLEFERDREFDPTSFLQRIADEEARIETLVDSLNIEAGEDLRALRDAFMSQLASLQALVGSSENLEAELKTYRDSIDLQIQSIEDSAQAQIDAANDASDAIIDGIRDGLEIQTDDYNQILEDFIASEESGLVGTIQSLETAAVGQLQQLQDALSAKFDELAAEELGINVELQSLIDSIVEIASDVDEFGNPNNPDSLVAAVIRLGESLDANTVGPAITTLVDALTNEGLDGVLPDVLPTLVGALDSSAVGPAISTIISDLTHAQLKDILPGIVADLTHEQLDALLPDIVTDLTHQGMSSLLQDIVDALDDSQVRTAMTSLLTLVAGEGNPESLTAAVDAVISNLNPGGIETAVNDVIGSIQNPSDSVQAAITALEDSINGPTGSVSEALADLIFELGNDPGGGAQAVHDAIDALVGNIDDPNVRNTIADLINAIDFDTLVTPISRFNAIQSEVAGVLGLAVSELTELTTAELLTVMISQNQLMLSDNRLIADHLRIQIKQLEDIGEILIGGFNAVSLALGGRTIVDPGRPVPTRPQILEAAFGEFLDRPMLVNTRPGIEPGAPHEVANSLRALIGGSTNAGGDLQGSLFTVADRISEVQRRIGDSGNPTYSVQGRLGTVVSVLEGIRFNTAQMVSAYNQVEGVSYPPRYAQSGLHGFVQSPEFPIVAHQGERVDIYSQHETMQMARLGAQEGGGGGDTHLHFRIDNLHAGSNPSESRQAAKRFANQIADELRPIVNERTKRGEWWVHPNGIVSTGR